MLPHQRPVNMMFQNYALFPHLNVRDNIAFGLKRAGMPRAEIDARVAEMVALVKLEGLEKRKPDQLSGGQKQRVALARSLARRPQVLLLDEPLAALDKKLRESTQLELMELQRRLGMTFIIVTHDQEEAMTVADRIGVMDAGRLEQVATPRELYEAPRSRWIAEFVGDVNLFEGQVESREAGRLIDRDARCRHHHRSPSRAQPLTKTTVCVAIRPEKVKLSRRGPASDAAMRMPSTGSKAWSPRSAISAASPPTRSSSTPARCCARRWPIPRGSISTPIRPSQRVVAWFTPDDCVVLEQ